MNLLFSQSDALSLSYRKLGTIFALVLPFAIDPLPRWCISEKHKTKESSPQEKP